VLRRAVTLDTRFQLAPGLGATLFAVPGKVPLYLEGDEVRTDLVGEQTVGVELTARGRRGFYIPGCASVPDWLRAGSSGAGPLLLAAPPCTGDGMLRAGVGAMAGRRVGRVPVSGSGGSLEALRDLDLGARIYVQLNDFDPLVDPASPERAEAQAAGW